MSFLFVKWVSRSSIPLLNATSPNCLAFPIALQDCVLIAFGKEDNTSRKGRQGGEATYFRLVLERVRDLYKPAPQLRPLGGIQQ
jgi:hypothetical protein